MEMRTERDSLGEMQVPADALYGAQTRRAVLNFPVSGQTMPGVFIRAMALIKQANAAYSAEEDPQNTALWKAVGDAAAEVSDGKHHDQFVVDIYQTGSGTSTNMNTNEVIARLASLRLGDPGKVHPNDHVNRGQSSNDVFPAAMQISLLLELRDRLIPALEKLSNAFAVKTEAFEDIVKIGRTHLQDATPVTLGQEFSGYKAQLDNALKRLRTAAEGLYPLPLGGTAVGSGLNTTRERTEEVVKNLVEMTGLPLHEAENHFEAQACRDGVVFFSGALKTLAVALMKIANDIRWLGSGPRCGLGEIKLPPTQPGSSIMPGKVNPVQAEAVTMVCARVMGNDNTISLAGASGNFELNVMMPVMAACGLESVSLLANVMDCFRTRCIEGIEADRKRCGELTEKSLALVTSLVPVLGYDRAAEIAKQAYREGLTIRQLLEESKEVNRETLERLLDPSRMTGDR